jgi:hypothetical protein
LKHLQKLTLGGSAITDAGLADLRGLRELGYLELFDTRVTDAGARELRTAQPKLKIVH